MFIANSTCEDIETIFKFYGDAVEHQKKVSSKQWQTFERSLIEEEIRENRQWKIVIEGEIACIFAITFNDPLIWKEKDIDPSIYIHRIVTHPHFRGRGFVKVIIKWARDYAQKLGKKFIRIDTWGDNKKINDYYKSCGFEYLGVTPMNNTEGLPKHYEGLVLSLLQIEIN